jgi:hypothetical protein
MNGFGDFIWQSGKSYSGNYVKDIKEGLGMFYWNDPYEIYLGYWIKGKRDGPALQIFGHGSNNKTYSFWENGKQIKLYESKSEAISYMNTLTQYNKKYKLFLYLDLDDLIKKHSRRVLVN